MLVNVETLLVGSTTVGAAEVRLVDDEVVVGVAVEVEVEITAEGVEVAVGVSLLLLLLLVVAVVVGVVDESARGSEVTTGVVELVVTGS